MKTTLSSGHGQKVAGASCYIDEVTEARKVVNRVKEIADTIKKGEVSTYHENNTTNKKDNLNTIIAHHNKTSRDLDVSVHFNSASFNGKDRTDNPVGIEIFYATSKGKPHAEALVKKLVSVSGLKNRGAKHTDGLGFLNKTTRPAILIEVCFVNSKKDVEIYKAKFEQICIAIAEYLTGGTYKPSSSTSNKVNYVVRVTTDVLNVRKGAGTNYAIATKVKKGEAFTIVEEANGNWGKLKSGAGWICLDYTEKVK